jgi:cell division protein FtsQ
LKKTKTIKRIIVVSAWFLVISGITTLLVAANRKQTERLCRQVVFSMKGEAATYYIEQSDIKKNLEQNTGGRLVGKPVKQIRLAQLEAELEQNPWIYNAQLYMDREDVLHVALEERQPIGRVFTLTGRSFYVDSTAHTMPLLERLSARVPVITGFPAEARWTKADSLLMAQVKDVALFVSGNDFWNAQIGQIDITPERRFELIPVVGDHIIRIGDAENIEDKMHRLLLFYKRVLSRIGFSKYSVIDVSFNGQVVARKKGPESAVDSIQLHRNIQELLEKSSIQNASDDMLPESNSVAVKKDTTMKMHVAVADTVAAQRPKAPAKAVATHPIENLPSKSHENKRSHPLPTARKPKAVMPPKRRY